MHGNSVTEIGNKFRARFAHGALALGVAALLTACDPGTDLELSTVKVQLTDAPADVIASAEVWISRVYLQGGGEEPDPGTTETTETTEAEGRVDLFNDAENPLHLDLLTLQNGVTADITEEIQVNAAAYQGLRLVVDRAVVTLVEGVTFEDGSGEATLFVPSGMESGIKVQLSDILDLQEGETTTVLVDFDVYASFVVQRNQGDGTIRRILLNPVLQEVQRQTVDG
jgi:hypothetical protein